MENQKSKKTLVILAISIAIIVLIVTVLVLALGKKDNTEPEKQNEVVESGNEIENFMDKISEAGKENSKVDVGKYVIPEENDFIWEEVEGGVAITKYTGEAIAVEVPEKLDEKDVVEIKKEAFGLVALVGIKLPDSLKTIGEKAFYYQMKLVEVTLGKNTEKIEENGFHGCVALKKIKLNEGLVSIGRSAFGMTSSLEKIELPDTLELIDRGAFVMGGLKSITIPGSVERIGEQAFSNCNSLETVIIEKGVKTLEDTCFEYCYNLVKIEIPESVQEIGWEILEDNKETVTIYAPEGSKAHEYAQEFEHKFKKIDEN